MLNLYRHALCIVLFIVSTSTAFSQTRDFDSIIKDAKKTEGFYNFYINESKGKIFLEVDKPDSEFLYYSSLPYGLGSNDIGLDRGNMGQGKVVKFIKSGNKLLLLQPNLRYRASSPNEQERKAVEQSFASSVLFGFEIQAEKDGRYLIDLTPFLLRDATGAAQTIAFNNQGNYSFDASRSALFPEMCKSFPLNTEFEAIITLSGSRAGQYLRPVVPTTDFITLHQHHSFVKLPDPGFKIRELDPRMGYLGVDYYDYSTGIDKPIVKKIIARHRLEKKFPDQAISEPVKPLIYYIDPGAPEPIRTALLEGAKWWNEAFEAAGFKNAFQVKVLPSDADPMDIRYNLVQWVHRSTRGWSFGGSITDPRTGEILKAKVTLGSLRVRQDYMIAQGLTANFDSGKEQPQLVQMALDRLHQLSAHEIGHTLGLPHNFIASIANRASVMDYPSPKVDIIDGKLNLSDAYAKGIGEFDKMIINWGYREFPKGTDEKTELDKIVDEAVAKGFVFLSDGDARPFGSVHPQTHLWDNGVNATDELKHVMQVRKIALNNFGKANIPTGTPYATLEEVLVPVYMFHRFQTEAAAKAIGGAYYKFGVKGDKLPVFTPASAKEQNAALDALLSTLSPGFLALSPELIKLIPPRAYRYGANIRETFKRHTGLTFDPLGPAEASAQLTLSLLLEPDRVSRLATQKILDPSLPSLNEVLARMTQTLWKTPGLNSQTYDGQIRRLTAAMYLSQLMQLTQDNGISVEALIGVREAINNIKTLTQTGAGINALMRDVFKRFESNPKDFAKDKSFTPPDGQPIDQDYDWLGLDEQTLPQW